MTTEANETFIEQVRPLIEFIEEQGGPKMYEWCRIFSSGLGHIWHWHRRKVVPHMSTPCQPAVTAAVCMWAMDVYAYFRVDNWVPSCSVYFDQANNKWVSQVSSKRTWHPTKELAFLALITAICKALGYQEGGE